MSLIFVVLGMVFLYLGGEFLVRNASALGTILGISPLVIGLTVVSFGTSAPELAATLFASLSNAPEIALGNVIGSNIANIGLILGLTALLYPLQAQAKFLRRDVPIMIVVSALLVPFLLDGSIGRLEGGFSLLILAAYLWYLFKFDAEAVEDVSRDVMPFWRVALGLVAGIAFLIIGARALVVGAVDIAGALGVPERVIGLSLVAFSTSLPELASSVVAALRKETAIILGNVVGSNIFNNLAVLGTTALVKPLFETFSAVSLDLWLMLAFSIALPVLMLRNRRLGRVGGAGLFLVYGAYVVYLF